MKYLIACVAAVVLSFSAATGFAADKSSPDNSKKSALVVERVNINSADADTIAANLQRVGLKKAEAIVAYRKANGSFKTKEQLLEVKGIGEATLEMNKDKIVL